MNKYAALETFLRSREKRMIRTTFAEIEKIVGQPLPASAKYPAWWSNNPSNNSMTKVWRHAGFRTEQVDVVRKTIVFRHVPPKQPEPPPAEDQKFQTGNPPEDWRAMLKGNASARRSSDKAVQKKKGIEEPVRTFSTSRHPLRGALKGVLRLVGGTDLSKPADPDWGGR